MAFLRGGGEQELIDVSWRLTRAVISLLVLVRLDYHIVVSNMFGRWNKVWPADGLGWFSEVLEVLVMDPPQVRIRIRIMVKGLNKGLLRS